MIKCPFYLCSLFSLSCSSFSAIHAIPFPFLRRGNCWSVVICIIPGHWRTDFPRWVLPSGTLNTHGRGAHAHITRRGDRYRRRLFSGRRIDIPGHCGVNPGHCFGTTRHWIIVPGHCGIYGWRLGVSGRNTGRLARLWIVDPVELAILQRWGDNYYYEACEASESIIGHRGIRFVCLSVCLSSVCRLSVCYQTPSSLWDRSLPKFIFGFFRPLRASVKIWYWPQSNPPPPQRPPENDPQNENFCFLTNWLEILYITSWPLPHHKSWLESQLQGAQLRISISFSFVCIDLKFCREPPDPCHIINHGLDLNYKVCNCACADLSSLLLHASTWNFVDNLLTDLTLATL